MIFSHKGQALFFFFPDDGFLGGEFFLPGVRLFAATAKFIKKAAF
jgi:hypothetical protein